MVALTRQPEHRVSPVERFNDEVSKTEKVALLRRVDDAARSSGSAIVQVSAGYGDSRKRIMIANTHGLLATDEQVRQNVRISVVANGDAGMQTGFQSAGHTFGFEMFDNIDVEELARDAARQALVKLTARPAPSGTIGTTLTSLGTRRLMPACEQRTLSVPACAAKSGCDGSGIQALLDQHPDGIHYAPWSE